MREKRNAYEIVGTNKIAVDRIKAQDNTEMNDKMKDKFICEKKESKMKELSRKIEITNIKIEMSESDTERQNMQAKSRALEYEKKLVERAYQKISDKEHRDKYNAYLEMLDKAGEFGYGIIGETRESQNQEARPKTAYEILGILQEKCDDSRKSTESIDRDLLMARDGLIEIAKARYEENVKAKIKNPFAAKQKLDLQIGILQEAYEKVATKGRRERYNKELQEQKRKERDEIEQKQLERIYNKRNIYVPTSIVTSSHQDMSEDGITMLRDNGQKLLLQQVGNIEYEDCFGLQGQVGEYEITRIVEDRVKTDKVYITDLDISDLGIDKNTGKLKNEAYYQFIANEMLSEESIEQCLKYNHGYLGEPLYDTENSKYIRFLGVREDLSAVMKYYEEKNKGQENSEKHEGDEYEQ